MPPQLLQPSFAAGELSPSLAARVDLAKYRVGARLLRNFFVRYSGGASTRPGTEFIGRVKDSANPVRLIGFSFSTLQTYVLELGGHYLRVIKDGGHVLEPAKTITSASRASPCVIGAPGHGYALGDEVYLSALTGMVEANGRRCLVGAITTDSFELHTLDDAPVDSRAWGAWSGGGTVARVYTVATPWAAGDLALLKTTQSADVLTICHPDYTPRDLTRSQHWVWTLTELTFQAKIATPGGLGISAIANPGGTQFRYAYQVTAVVDAPREESTPSDTMTVTNAALNQNTGVGNTLSWSAVPGANRYNIYATSRAASGAASGSVYGYIGQATATSFTDDNRAPDFSQGPPAHANPFAGGNNPGCTCYFEGRKGFAGAKQKPQTIYLTQPGNFGNFDTAAPTKDSDAITATLAARQVNAIRHLVPSSGLLALTGSGAWLVSGGSQADVVTPANLVAKPQSYNGCNHMPPIAIGEDLLYVQDKGTAVRDLSYNFYANVFKGTDLSVLATHLFEGYQLTEWAWCEEPFKMIWAVRNDGVLLGFTYLKDQDVYAWTRQVTAGRVRSVASISEGQEDALYLVVERTLPGVNGGQPVQYVERLASRNWRVEGVTDVTRVWCVDCGLRYDGAPATVISGLEHLEGGTVAITADGSVEAAQTVIGGQVTLQQPASRVTIGLSYLCRLETLRVESEPTIQGRRKRMPAVSLIVEDARGLKVGPLQGKLIEIKDRDIEAWNEPTRLRTGTVRLVLDPLWDSEGALAIEQGNPLPATILGILPELMVGDTPG